MIRGTEGPRDVATIDAYLLRMGGEPIALGQAQRLAYERLRTAAKRQQVVAATGRFQGYNGDSLSKFPKDPEYEALIVRIMPLIKRLYANSGADEEGLRGGFRGEILERISFLHLSAKYIGLKTIITPEDTERFIAALHPEGQLRRGGSLQRGGIQGVRMPDMIAVGKDGSTITDVYEVTINPNHSSKANQSHQLQSEMDSQVLFGGVAITPVYPKNSAEGDLLYGFTGIPEELPFGRTALERLESRMYSDALVRLELAATPEDIRQREEYQKRVVRQIAESSALPAFTSGWEAGTRGRILLEAGVEITHLA